MGSAVVVNKTMSKKVPIAALITLVIAISAPLLYRAYTSNKHTAAEPTENAVRVAASFYPLAFLAERVGGKHAIVTNITPTGAEPHDYEPSARDIAMIESSNMLILNGGSFEPWAEKIKSDLTTKNVVVLESGTKLMTRQTTDEHLHEEESTHEEVNHEEVISDPHIWLDPVLAEELAREIATSFKTIDPENAGAYDSNTEALVDELHNLHTRFEQGLRACTQKNIVTAHAAFGYLAERYGLNQVALSGLSPDAEPSPRDLAEIAAFAKQNNVQHIFFEELVSPRLAETLAQEIGAQTLVLNPIEGLTPEQNKSGENYFTLMDKNLTHLRTALACQ